MRRYANWRGNSGVREYESGPGYIKIRFRSSSKIYVYDDNTPGREHVDRMKQLADEGRGLSSYVSRVVRDRYAWVE